MNFKEYQVESRKTASYPKIGSSIEYPLMGFMGEFGEFCEKFKKVLRDNNGQLSEDRKEGIIGELGDICWYLFQLYSELKIDFQDSYIQANVDPSYTRTIIHILVAMQCCIADMSIYCLSKNQTLMSSFIEKTSVLIYFIQKICKTCGVTIEDVMQKNINKLQSRLQRNVIKGDGDNR